MPLITPLTYGPFVQLEQQYDCCWFLVDEQQLCLEASECVALGQMQVRIHFGQLQCSAPGMLRLEIPLDVLEDDDEIRRKAFDAQANKEIAAIDEGALAATWFTHVMGRPCRLFKKDPGRPVDES